MSSFTEPLSWLEVHLDRLRWNYLSLQKRLKRGADCAAVVKADAYGLGAVAIVPELYKSNCRHFFVANVAGGIVVRDTLGENESRIYVFNGPYAPDAADFARNNLIPVLNTPGDIEYWSGFAKKSGRKQPAVIQVDTGMNRMGLSPDEVKRLGHNTDILKPLDVRYIMSHLACADTPEHPKNREQLEKFMIAVEHLGLPCPLSFANSSGIFLGEDFHFDLARPGAALYGINPQNTDQNPMQGVVTLKVRILQTREAAKGETVGYGANYTVSSPTKLATISAGYADGILRSFTTDGAVFIRGQKCPVVGRVSMEAIVVDVTQLSPPPQVGEWAEIIGEHQTVDDVAAAAKTIGYEILTGLGGKHKRIYSGQAQA